MAQINGQDNVGSVCVCLCERIFDDCTALCSDMETSAGSLHLDYLSLTKASNKKKKKKCYT